MATIGRSSAVVATKRVALHGFWAWMMWWVVHIYFLVGFRNRALMVAHWAWSWLSFQRGARLITGDIPHLPRVHELAADGGAALPSPAEVVALAPQTDIATEGSGSRSA
jgi:NADH dehydrogenase